MAWAALALAALAGGGACGISPSVIAPNQRSSGPDFTLVALPDTQYYAAAHPDILDAQIAWIAREAGDQKIALVLHEGDIVDADEPAQWARAAGSLHTLDGLVPYILSSGNHDYDRSGQVITRRTLIDRYFAPPSTGLYEPGRIENRYEIVPAPGGPWLILSLEFGPRDAVLAWADRVAKRYATLPAIVVTHAYLASDNARFDHLGHPEQLWNPHRYLDDRVPGSVNDGEEIWRKLVVRNDNILFVLCGHDLGDGVGRLDSARPDGTTVHQILANYQMQALGGGGYLRLLQFSPAERRVRVRTYSPYLNEFKTDPDNDFHLAY
ncbi:MAG TPA: metallophosphoesterase [Polyangia bacterium]|nr:metallophosphoesterase [Polyangia bacterium]